MPQSDKQPTACDRVLAHYRERVGGAWRPADDILFRAAWNEGAHERERQLSPVSDRLLAARQLLVRATGALAVSHPGLADDIIRHLSEPVHDTQ